MNLQWSSKSQWTYSKNLRSTLFICKPEIISDSKLRLIRFLIFGFSNRYAVIHVLVMFCGKIRKLHFLNQCIGLGYNYFFNTIFAIF